MSKELTLSEIEKEYREILDTDVTNCFPWETEPDRSLKVPTNLGAGRGRFWHVYKNLRLSIKPGNQLIDFGAYPGTLLRVLRQYAGEEIELAAAGFGFSEDFRAALNNLNIQLLEMEFDARRPITEYHGLDYPLHQVTPTGFDIAVCTDVIEHLMYPVFLLSIINRFSKTGGTVYLTTNNVCFMGSIFKLLVGRHNVEEIEFSHVLTDHLWRPHIRLFTLAEISFLFQLTGFRVEQAYYFDNGEKGRLYTGSRGLANASIRWIASIVPHFRSHIFIGATKVSTPAEEAARILKRTIETYGLQHDIHYRDGDCTCALM